MRQIAPIRPLTQTTFESLREAICTGAIAPNERLIQHELATQLGTSRLPVHEALQQLRREGFASETGRRGLVASPLDAVFLENLFELRAALDRTAAMSAARKRSPKDKALGMAIIARGRSALAARRLRDIAAADFEFHDLVYRIGGNPLIAMTAGRNWHHVRRAFLLLSDVTPELVEFWEDHTTILHAISIGDEAEAGRLSAEHSIRSGLAYSAILNEEVAAPQDAKERVAAV